jgi:hypothetical protein
MIRAAVGKCLFDDLLQHLRLVLSGYFFAPWFLTVSSLQLRLEVTFVKKFAADFLPIPDKVMSG